jgi:hypothetical protein
MSADVVISRAVATLRGATLIPGGCETTHSWRSLIRPWRTDDRVEHDLRVHLVGRRLLAWRGDKYLVRHGAGYLLTDNGIEVGRANLRPIPPDR